MERTENSNESAVSLKHRFKFIKRLSDILKNEMLNHIVAWSQDGSSVDIKDSNAFSEVVLQQYYKHNNLTNFIRQLNMYNFKKVRKLHTSGLSITYRNPLFSRDQPQLLPQIERKKKDKSSDLNSTNAGPQMPELEKKVKDENRQQSPNNCHYEMLRKEINDLRRKLSALTKINKDLLRNRKKSADVQSNASSYIISLEFVIGLLYQKIINQEDIDLPNYDLVQEIHEISKSIALKDSNKVKGSPEEFPIDKTQLRGKKRRASFENASNGLDYDLDYSDSRKADIVAHVLDQMKTRMDASDNLANSLSFDRLKATLCLNSENSYDLNSDYKKCFRDEPNFEKQFPQESFCYLGEDTLSKTVSFNNLYFDN